VLALLAAAAPGLSRFTISAAISHSKQFSLFCGAYSATIELCASLLLVFRCLHSFDEVRLA
jgi:hypothetical protein